MKLLLLTLILLAGVTCNEYTVYVCDSTGALKYHLTDKCRGLSNCNYRIIPTTADSAIKKGKTLCRWEQ